MTAYAKFHNNLSKKRRALARKIDIAHKNSNVADAIHYEQEYRELSLGMGRL